MAALDPWSSLFGPPLKEDAFDGRPSIYDVRTPFHKLSVGKIDRLLVRLREVHLVPRYDIPKELAHLVDRK